MSSAAKRGLFEFFILIYLNSESKRNKQTQGIDETTKIYGISIHL